ncbi:MAG: 30S ribosomal protein S5 [Thermofilum sp.]|jgi:small subunit ribosomal protein S5|uniref:Small ribosomal subunit protein uS5 n=2 Tax=Thermofilum adornatum TaxID=1365176 RepID=S5ZJW8_9CREN|nr:30S ribosomal protein S5 [Thermofilum adornatum]AGT34811.1 30S ribosomal protein S5 [Thermofilum adornatum]AJB42537.1 SSU ribosomal protein S2e (S5p) [Thermofilum adornatum 1505]MCC5997725.1 30S ribosomal protein S5 [Thermofilum sp.]
MASEWQPRTLLGKMVLEGKIKSIDEIFAKNIPIKEVEIIDTLLPDLKSEVISVGFVQRQTDSGEVSQYQVTVVVGNENGYVGVGMGKSRQIGIAIEKATRRAKLNIIPVRRGCGSWECLCGKPHSIPYKVEGKAGSVKIELIPAPRGVGIVASDVAKTVLRLAGISDVWSRSYGETRTTHNMAKAVYNALKKTYEFYPPSDW